MRSYQSTSIESLYQSLPRFHHYNEPSPEMAHCNYRLPLRIADKTITKGPDTTIRVRTVSCAITSRSIWFSFTLHRLNV